MSTSDASSFLGYRIAGALYVLLGLPGLAALVLGKLHRGGDPYFALSGALVLVGALFLVFGLGRREPNSLSEGALKMSIIALIQPPFLVLFHRIMQDNPGFGTAYHFTAVFLGFLALLSAVLLGAALSRNPSAA